MWGNLSHDAFRLAFSPDPRPDKRPRSGPAGDGAPGHRSSRTGVRGAHARAAGRAPHDLQDVRPGGDVSGSGSGACEAALVNTLSPGDRVLIFETGHFSRRLEEDRRAAWPSRGLCAGQLAPRRFRGRPRSAADRRHGAGDQGRRGRAQRDVHGRGEPHSRPSTRDEPRRPPGVAHRGRGLVAGLVRLPPRRVGRRRHRVRIAKRPDGSAGHRLRGGVGKSAPRREDGDAAARLLGVGRDHQAERGGLFPVHACPRTFSTACARRSRCWRKRGWTTSSPGTHGTREATRAAVRAWGLELVCEDPARVLELADGDFHARGPRRRSASRDHPRELRHVARHRPLASSPAACSASAISAASTT